jgi:hypothetical protein
VIEAGQSWPTETDVVEIRAELSRFGVDPEVQVALVEKLRVGEVWDSLKPGASPIDETTVTDTRRVTTLMRYADGSVKASTVSVPQSGGGVEPRGVSECIVTNATSYGYWARDCHVAEHWVLFGLDFRFDWESIRGSSPEITNYGTAGQFCVGCTIGGLQFSRVNRADVRLTGHPVFPMPIPVSDTLTIGVKIVNSAAQSYSLS